MKKVHPVMHWTKRRRNGGFSLAELLVATIILTILTSSIALTITSALKVRSDVITVTDAQLLGSTAAQLIRDELRYGRNIRIDADKDSIILDSTMYNANAEIHLDENGRLMLGHFEALGDGSYNNGLRMKDLVTTIDTNSGVAVANVAFKVVNKKDVVLWNQSIVVRLLNESETETQTQSESE